jgi:hypothetical protein
MMRVLGSIDRDEVVYHVLLAFSIAFTALRVFMTFAGVAGKAAGLVSQIAVALGS